jgi:protein-S-isoprenylcysteine O-methyltransferase Ste14
VRRGGVRPGGGGTTAGCASAASALEKWSCCPCCCILERMAANQQVATTKFVIGCWLVFVATWIVAAFWAKRTRAQQPLADRLWYLALTVVAAVLLNGSVRIIHWNRAVLPHTLATGILGDFLALVGLFIAIWARVTLGGNWSARVALKEDHQLIQRGPYRVVRHPIYSGLLLMILGTAVLAGQVSGFVALGICFGGFWVKLRQEEALLTAHLPGYSEYVRRTKALLPFIL